jgi:drug/metabolite transporter (DMT)-like permease
MFQGRTATFAGVVNRLTSLLAGTTSTLLMAWIWHQKPPSVQDWASFLFILVAVGFLTQAERHRMSERAAAPVPAAPAAAPVAAAPRA